MFCNSWEEFLKGSYHLICEDLGSWKIFGPGRFCDVCLGREVGSISVATKVWEGGFSIRRVRTAGRVGVLQPLWEEGMALLTEGECQGCNSWERHRMGVSKRKLQMGMGRGVCLRCSSAFCAWHSFSAFAVMPAIPLQRAPEHISLAALWEPSWSSALSRTCVHPLPLASFTTILQD